MWRPLTTGRPLPHQPTKRTTAASSAKNQAAAILTTPSRDQETIMATATLTMPAPGADSASPPSLFPPVPTGVPAVLALDLGTTTGWALRGRDNRITSGTMTFKPRRFEGGGTRYLRFNAWLREIAALGGPFQRIVFEEVRRHVGTDAAHVFGGLFATLTTWAEMHSIPYEGVPVGTIKRFATGRGNADKAAMIAAMKARGFTPADDNEADALAPLLWATDARGGLA
jgi:hypothetical protein